MANETEAFTRIEKYAKAVARKVLRLFDLHKDENEHEEVSQTLFLAGWQVWRDTQNVEYALHRISSRGKNEKKKLHKRLKVKLLGEMDDPKPWFGCDDDVDETEREHTELDPTPDLRRGVAVRTDPDDAVVIQERIARLTPRQKDIWVRLVERKSQQQIAEELGVSLRTVEREIAHIFQKETADE